MSQTAIPLQFEKYLQDQIRAGKAPDMNEMIFARLPDLDPSQPIDRKLGIADKSLWVHQQVVDQVGKLGDNALVYSVVIPGSVPAFTFNAIYLHDRKVPNSCGMVIHKATETKEAGMASTKNLMQQYSGAAQIAGITVDAATWQIDYQARLLGIEEALRLASLDHYGHTAFIAGFEVSQQADPTKYHIAPGVAYVGGLRAELKDAVLQTLTDKPSGLYVDVVRRGTPLSQWQNIVTVRASVTPLTDYLDKNEAHYVARLAGIDADGRVTSWRLKGGVAALQPAWSPAVNYAVGQVVVYDKFRYTARRPSGPDHGGAVAPDSDSGSTWDRALPEAHSTTDRVTPWIKIAQVCGEDHQTGDHLALSVFGGSDFGAASRFSAEMMMGERGDRVSVSAVRKTSGADDPTFFTQKMAANTYALWMKRQTAFSSPVTVIRHSRSQSPSTVAGILNMTQTEPTDVMPVIFDNDTGHQWTLLPVGVPLPVKNALLPPTTDSRFRYIKLTVDDDYNAGVLGNKVVTGVYPNLVYSMTVTAPASPLKGTVIRMLNSMQAGLQPSLTEGEILPDAMRNLIGDFALSDDDGSHTLHLRHVGGVFDRGINSGIDLSARLKVMADEHEPRYEVETITFDASSQVPTAPRFQGFAEGWTYMMRIY